MSFEPIILTPQEEQREIFPYRRVWRTAIIEAAILLVITAAVTVAARFVTFNQTDTQRQVIAFGFALLPLALWLVFSYGGERRAAQPRERIFMVLLLTALAANAVGEPLIARLFTVDEWLSIAPGTTRILGYTLIVGVMQQFIKYAVLRYSVWPTAFRTRSDGIAYALAAAVGYATVLNINYALTTPADPGAAILRITENTLSQAAISTIIGYVLAELNLNRQFPIFWMPGALLLSALLTALAITFRGGVVVAAISSTGNASNAVQGLGVVVFLTVALFASFFFLINNADERSQSRRRTELPR